MDDSTFDDAFKDRYALSASGKIKSEITPLHDSFLQTGSIQGGGGSNVSAAGKISFFRRLQMIDDPEELVDPIASHLFPVDEFIDFCMYYGIESEHARYLFNGGNYPQVIRDGALRRMCFWVKGFRRTDDGKEKLSLEIPVGELHAPNVEKAEAKYKITRTTKKGGSLNVLIKAVGAGVSKTKECKVEQSIPVRPGECRGLVCNCDVIISRWRNDLTNSITDLVDEIDIFDIAKVVSIENYPIKRDEKEHICMLEDAYSVLDKKVKNLGFKRGDDFRIMYGADEPIPETNITISKEYRYIEKFKAGGATVLEVVSQFTVSTEMSVKLPNPYEYIVVFGGEKKLPLAWGARKTA